MYLDQASWSESYGLKLTVFSSQPVRHYTAQVNSASHPSQSINNDAWTKPLMTISIANLNYEENIIEQLLKN